MPKRFAETELWDKSWFIDLKPEFKLVWQYLMLNCDSAGLWEIDIRQLKRKTGLDKVDLQEMINAFNRDYDLLTDEAIPFTRILFTPSKRKLWLTGFVSSQYEKGTKGVNANIPAIKGALNRLQEEGILCFAIDNGYVRVFGAENTRQNSSQENAQSYGSDEHSKYNNSVEIPHVINSPSSPHITEAAPSPGAAFNKEEKFKEADINNSINSLSEVQDFIIPINNIDNNNKGCEPLPGDKDIYKDKDSGGCSLKPSGGAGGVGDCVQPNLSMTASDNLFKKVWGQLPKTSGERALAEELLQKAGADEFEFALKEALQHKKFTLAYIRGIIKNRRQAAENERLKAEQLKRQREQMEKAASEQKQGVRLNLIEQVYGEKSRMNHNTNH